MVTLEWQSLEWFDCVAIYVRYVVVGVREGRGVWGFVCVCLCMVVYGHT